jgi:arylsulfatase A-like enzyme
MSAGDAGGEPSLRALRHALGPILGFALLALTNAIAIALCVPWPRGGLAVRAAHHVFDAAETMGLGGLSALLVGLYARFVRLPWVLGVALFAVALAPVMYVTLGDDLWHQATFPLDGRLEAPLLTLYVALCALAMPAAHVVGMFLGGRPRLRWVAVAVGLGVLVADQVVTPDDYFAIHGAVACVAAILAGAALAPAALPIVRAGLRRPAGRAAAAALAVTMLAGLLVPPGNAIRVELFRRPVTPGAWALAATLWRSPEGSAPPPSSPWFEDRSALPAVPPTAPRVAPPNPVVVMVTIDAVRADVVDDPANDALLPTLAELKRSSAVFTRAVAPGSQTAVSLSTAFTGRYFSQLLWAPYGTGASRFVYPAADPSPRFPEILTARGVGTATFCSVKFLAGEFGVARGFAEERMIASGRRHAFAVQVVDPLLDRLRRAGDGPLFLFAHLMEPHEPYDRGAQVGTDRERYLSEIAVADVQLGRVLRLLTQRFPERGLLIVAADHGEAFGEHGTYFHTKTLYDELLRVPLLVHGAGVEPRVVSQRVGLIDLGPTLLDLFGVPTPPTFLGQSLVPLLLGRDAPLDRPLLAEGRLRRALYAGDLKVIEDPRRKLVEAYDLERDPGELDDLFDTDPARATPALAALRAFFAVHAVKKPGYTPPYKP